jgi:hypothetical protein
MNVIFTRRSEIITYCQIQLINLLQVILNLPQKLFSTFPDSGERFYSRYIFHTKSKISIVLKCLRK